MLSRVQQPDGTFKDVVREATPAEEQAHKIRMEQYAANEERSAEEEIERREQRKARPLAIAFEAALKNVLGKPQPQRQTQAQTPPQPQRHTLPESVFDLLEEQKTTVPELITGLFPSTSVNILVGDSGLGKTPLVIQMAVCVALGKPFLGIPVQRAKVLLVDYENYGLLAGMVQTITEYLGSTLEEVNKWLLPLRNPVSIENVMEVAESFGAGFITVDALRGLCPAVESKPEMAVVPITKLQTFKACWLILHHIRKDNRENKRPALDAEDTTVMKWLEEAAGTRALINQTSTRIAIDKPAHDKAALLMRPFYKGKGETGRIFITRVISDDGEPVGYEVARGIAMLSLNHRAWFQQVDGKSYRFPELWALFQAHHDKIGAFVRECEIAGLATVTGTLKSRTDPRTVRFGEMPQCRSHGESAEIKRDCETQKEG